MIQNLLVTGLYDSQLAFSLADRLILFMVSTVNATVTARAATSSVSIAGSHPKCVARYPNGYPDRKAPTEQNSREIRDQY